MTSSLDWDKRLFVSFLAMAMAWRAFAAGPILRVISPADAPAGSMTSVKIEVTSGNAKGTTSGATVPAALHFKGQWADFVRRGNGLYLVGKHPEGMIEGEDHAFWLFEWEDDDETIYEDRSVYLGEIAPNGEVTLDGNVSAAINQRPRGGLGKFFTGETHKTAIEIKPAQFGRALPMAEDSPNTMPTDELGALKEIRTALLPLNESPYSRGDRGMGEGEFLSNFHGEHGEYRRGSLDDLLPLIHSPAGRNEALGILVNNLLRKGLPLWDFERQGALESLRALGPEASEDPMLSHQVRDLLLSWLKEKYSAGDSTTRLDLLKAAHQWFQAKDADAAGRAMLLSLLGQAAERNPAALAEIDSIHGAIPAAGGCTFSKL